MRFFELRHQLSEILDDIETQTRQLSQLITVDQINSIECYKLPMVKRGEGTPAEMLPVKLVGEETLRRTLASYKPQFIENDMTVPQRIVGIMVLNSD